MTGLTGNNILAGSSGQGGYEIEQSLRFEDGDSAYLSRTLSSPTDGKVFTLSFWLKRGNIGTSVAQWFFSGSGGNDFLAGFNASSDALQVAEAITGYGQTTDIVFRDVGTWYHITIIGDSTQASNDDRIKIYVNGSQVTTTKQNTITQNSIWGINTASATANVGRYTGGSGYSDGYLAEVNFIDGQALDPSNFGETNLLTNQWIPKKYVGTYGTNGFYLPFSNGTSWSNYFDFSGDYIRVPSSSGAPFDFGTGDFTVEGWFYLTTSGSWTSYWGISQGGGASQKINLYDSTGNGTLDVDINGSVVFSSSSVLSDLLNKWAHIALVREGTGTNETKLYVNGSVVGQGTVSANFSGFTQPFTIGHNGELYSGAFKGYISNFRVVKGTAVYTGSFTPPTSDLTAISGTQLLTCQNSTFIDNSSNNLTVTVSGDTRTEKFSPISLDFPDDHSGSANNFIPTNLTHNDVLLDSPTNNFCTLLPTMQVIESSGTYSEGNLSVSKTGNFNVQHDSSIRFNSGKWYWEVLVNQLVSPASNYYYIGTQNHVWASNGDYYDQGTPGWVAQGVTFTQGDLISVAVDYEGQTIKFYKNGSLTLDKTLYPAVIDYFSARGRINGNGGTGENIYNFGQDSSFAGNKTAQNNTDDNGIGDFYYAPPSGYLALCEDNLSDPSIALPGDHFNTLLYTGLYGTSDSYTGVGFQPDFTWLKHRDNPTAYSHQLYDSVRGATNYLVSNTNADENDGGASFTLGLKSFDSDGFTLGQTLTINASGVNHASWNWKADNTSGSSNTDGDITSTVSVNTTSGFSIVTYTGSGSYTSGTVGHGLSQAPDAVFIKKRNSNGADGVRGWRVWHKDLTDAYFLTLNGTNAAFLDRAFGESGNPTYPYVAPTSSVIQLGGTETGSYQEVNYSGDDYVMYCFHEVEGYSKFGSYTGNRSTDGPFVYTGFQPAFVLIKRTNAVDSWFIFDVQRDTVNPLDSWLAANLTNTETVNLFADAVSNGFKVRGDILSFNANGGTYIYMAFAKSPFKYSNAR